MILALLDLSRIQEGQLTLVPEAVDTVTFVGLQQAEQQPKHRAAPLCRA